MICDVALYGHNLALDVNERSAHVAASFMRKEPLVLVGEEVGLDRASVWMLWRREKCPSLKGIESRFPSFPAHSVVTIATELSWPSC